MHLEHLCDWTTPISNPVIVGDGPLGDRLIVNIKGGEVNGPRLSGRVLPNGGDWALAVPGRYLRLDARMLIETHDDALICVTYTARVALTDAFRRVLLEGHGETDFGENYWIAQMQFETGNERYAWLNDLMATGEGRLQAGPEVSYRVYALEAN